MRYIMVLILATLLFGCESNFKETDVLPNKGFIKFSLEGKEYSYNYLPVKGCYPDTQVDEDINQYYRIGANIPLLVIVREKNNQLMNEPLESFISLAFFHILPDDSSTEYSLNHHTCSKPSDTWGQVQLYIANNGVRETYFGNTFEQVEIKILSNKNNRIKGSFSGTLVGELSGSVLHITKGEFDVEYKNTLQ